MHSTAVLNSLSDLPHLPHAMEKGRYRSPSATVCAKGQLETAIKPKYLLWEKRETVQSRNFISVRTRLEPLTLSGYYDAALVQDAFTVPQIIAVHKRGKIYGGI